MSVSLDSAIFFWLCEAVMIGMVHNCVLNFYLWT